MSPRVRGTLDGPARADTFTFWRRPGQYRYELEVHGEAAAELCLEAFRPGGAGSSSSTGGWTALEERLPVKAGPMVVGVVAVPEAWIDSRLNADWVQLRVRISRSDPNQTVEYEFYLEPGPDASTEPDPR